MAEAIRWGEAFVRRPRSDVGVIDADREGERDEREGHVDGPRRVLRQRFGRRGRLRGREGPVLRTPGSATTSTPRSSSAAPTARSRSTTSTRRPRGTVPGKGLALGAVAAILPGIGLGVGMAVGAGIGAVSGHIKGGMKDDDLKQLAASAGQGPGRVDRAVRDEHGRPGRCEHQGGEPLRLPGDRRERRRARQAAQGRRGQLRTDARATSPTSLRSHGDVGDAVGVQRVD